MEKISILFVCMGNICRSPTAEGVARLLIERAGFANRVAKLDSAGTHGAHAGEAPDPRATRMAASRGYDLSRLRARQVSPKDFVTFNHVVAMDRANLRYSLAVLARRLRDPATFFSRRVEIGFSGPASTA